MSQHKRPRTTHNEHRTFISPQRDGFAWMINCSVEALTKPSATRENMPRRGWCVCTREASTSCSPTHGAFARLRALLLASTLITGEHS